MKIIYFGSPQFAVLPLQALLEAGHEIAAAVTQPDRRSGRGRQLCPTPVKQFAVSHNIPVLQQEKVNEEASVAQILSYGAELLVTVAFGQILKRDLLYGTKYGAINLHASLLPAYRGAAPIHYALWRGETRTGLTTMYMDEGMDTGDMIYQAEYEILPDDNTERLYEKLSVLGAQLLCRTVADIESGTAPRIPQNEAEASYASLLKKEDEIIDWRQSAAQIFNHIRAFNSWPGVYTLHEGKRLKLWEARPLAEGVSGGPGEISIRDDGGVKVCCGGGSVLLLLCVQPEGRGKMSAADWARGQELKPGEILG